MTIMHAKVGAECRNTGFTDRFTCPNCYSEWHGPLSICTGCGASIQCRVEHDPVAVCELVDPSQDDDEEDDDE